VGGLLVPALFGAAWRLPRPGFDDLIGREAFSSEIILAGSDPR
jgi:hypothetical protein